MQRPGASSAGQMTGQYRLGALVSVIVQRWAVGVEGVMFVWGVTLGQGLVVSSDGSRDLSRPSTLTMLATLVSLKDRTSEQLVAGWIIFAPDPRTAEVSVKKRMTALYAKRPVMHISVRTKARYETKATGSANHFFFFFLLCMLLGIERRFFFNVHQRP